MMPHIPEFRKETPEENTKEPDTVLPYGKPGENTVCPLCVKWTSSGLAYDPHGEPPPNAIFWGDLPEAEVPSDSYGPPPPPAFPPSISYGDSRAPPSYNPPAPPANPPSTSYEDHSTS